MDLDLVIRSDKAIVCASAKATIKPLTCKLFNCFISYQIIYLKTRARLECKLYLFSVVTWLAKGYIAIVRAYSSLKLKLI